MIKEVQIPKLHEEAKEKGLKFYFSGIPCKHGHISKRWVRNAHCLDCEKKIWNPKNRAKPYRKKYMKEYRLKYKDTQQGKLNLQKSVYLANFLYR